MREVKIETIRSIDRAIDILQAFTIEKPFLSLDEIAKITKIPRSTAYRILYTLETRKLVQIDKLSMKYKIGLRMFEFSTMLSFAIPGTVIGVSYILAFNFPPIELTGTSIILVIVFVFRNMPVGVRGGIAAMSQLDKSLDEASITLGANSFTTARRVIAPLLGPAILAALTYSFVRAITSVSAVIFLVSAKHNMATSFIVGRVENGEFGIAIAYSAVLIVTMITAIMLLQLLIGRRKLRASDRVET